MIRQQPFVPFRLYLSDSQVFDVRHQEMAWVGREAALLGLLNIDGYLDRAERIALAHIVRLEPIHGVSAAE